MRHAYSTGALRSLVTILAVTACASHGGAPKGDGGYPPWPPGHYDLRATVSYRMDSDAGARTERAELRADLFIAPDGSLSLQSSSGLCHGRTQEEMGLDRSRGQGVFYCQDVRYILRPMGGTVGGEVLVSVSEGYRTRGACVRYEQTATGGRVCVEYRWYVDYRNTTKRASLRVTPRS
jgi:hypothetical protein